MLPITDSSPHTLLLTLRRSGLVERRQKVLAAVSGGPDSTALLVALHEEGHQVVAAHYNHALQPASDIFAAHVRALCDRIGVALVTERRAEPLPRGSVQAGARSLRYQFLERARVLTGSDVVALAHTADDVVEGVILHLLRGCGLAGLRGMPSRREALVRPLLSVWRSEVIDFLRRRDIEPLEDPANSDPAFERVRVRREVLPALERDRPGITRHFHGAAMRAAALQESVAAEAQEAIAKTGAARSRLTHSPEPVAVEVLKRLYVSAGGPEPGLSRQHLQSMLRLVGPGRGGRGVDLPGAKRFRIVGDSMEIVAAGPRPTDGEPPRLSVTTCTGCDDPRAFHLKPGLDLRLGYRSPGLRMRPLGGRGTRKLQDIFVDARVPREDRDRWPLVFAGENLAVVPGVAISADFASRAGEESAHVTINEIPATVKSPDSFPGDPT